MKKTLFLLLCCYALTGAAQEHTLAASKHSRFASHHTRTAQDILHMFLTPTPDYILVAAHRGDWRNAPENSIHSLRLAIEMHVDIVEADVRKTKDGTLIIMHDDHIDRTTSGNGKVEDLTWDDLKQVTLRQGHGGPTEEHIPTFEAFMDFAKGKPILVNLDKGWDIIPEIYAVLKKTGTVEQALFKGSLPLSDLRKKFGCVVDSIHYIPMFHPADFTEPYPTDAVSGFYDHYRPAGFELVFNSPSSPILTYALPAIKARSTTVWVNALWPSQCAGHDDEKAMLDPDANWGWLITLGANVIQTDRPKDLLSYLHNRDLH